MKPKYEVGIKVYTNLWGKRQSGTVIDCINAEDAEDVKKQGFRYYVNLGTHRHTYSIVEKYLWIPKVRVKSNTDDSGEPKTT